jgi:hypothetical protein
MTTAPQFLTAGSKTEGSNVLPFLLNETKACSV